MMAPTLQIRRGNKEASTNKTPTPRHPKRRETSRSFKGVVPCSNHSLSILAFVLLAASLVLIAKWYLNGNGNASISSKPRAVTPLNSPKIMDSPQFHGKRREDLFWGTYRPNLYLGMRTRTPKSLLAGLMWTGINNGAYALRHTCEDGDNLSRYGWLRHDGSKYGHQEIVDGNVLLSTHFLKSKELGSGYGGDWAVRLSARSLRRRHEGDNNDVAHLFFYLADEAGDVMKIERETSDDTLHVSASKQEIGGWELHVKKKEEVNVHYLGQRTLHMHNLTQLVLRKLQKQAQMSGLLQLPDFFKSSSNLAVFQFTGKMPFELDLIFLSGVNSEDGRMANTKVRVASLSGKWASSLANRPSVITPSKLFKLEFTGKMPFELDLIFLSGVTSEDGRMANTKVRVASLSGEELTEKLARKEQEFETRFEETFHLKEKVVDGKSIEVGKAALSNLLGGIGYFYGQSRIAVPINQRHAGGSYWLYWPAALYTAVPCRSSFPRGFLWDEGFHQLLIRRWDREISMEIIGHWLDLINIDGWIPREQILGSEALSKIPEEFVPQYTSDANPPTFFLALKDFVVDMMNRSSRGLPIEDEYEFLQRSFPRLDAWFQWFTTSQRGNVDGRFFWHGRDSTTNRELNPKTLSSGLDDYPRASHPSKDERHVDLRCWIALAAETMKLISKFLGVENKKYQATSELLSDMNLLNQLHYDSSSGSYHDYGNHTEKAKLKWRMSEDPRSGQIYRELIRVEEENPKLQFVPHFGYVSLFPFIMKMLPPDSPILAKQLLLIRDDKLLWTGYGLRSLSTTSSIYMKHNTEHDAPYWRGTVWLNLNYLVLSSLHHYSQESGKYRNDASNLYAELRENLIRNVVERFSESGYLWEQYDNSAEGKGKGAHPFTGWTSLILLIMAEMYRV